MKSSKFITFIFILLVIVIVYFGITANKSQYNTNKTQEFNLAVNTWVGYAPFYLAQDKGFFQDEGLDLNITVIEGVTERKAALLAGRIDAIGSTVDSLVFERDEGVPSVSIVALDYSNGADGVVAQQDIKSISDLRGKKVAVQKNFVGESFLLYLLRKNNVPVSSVDMIDTETGAAGAAFVAGQVDVAVTWEPWLSKARERKDGHVLVTSADEPGVIVDVLNVREDVLKNRKDDVKKLVRGWFRAVDYWKENPKEANAIMAKYYDMPVDEFEEIISGVKWPDYKENISYFSRDVKSNIYDVADIFTQVFLETGSISSEPDMTKAVDDSVLMELY